MIVYTTGSFDGDIYAGHLNLINTCKQFGDLYIYVVPDWVIVKYKKRNPIYSQRQRVLNLSKLDVIPLFMSGNTEEENFNQVLNSKMDIYSFGEDQINTWNNNLRIHLLCKGVICQYIPRLPNISTTQLYFKQNDS